MKNGPLVCSCPLYSQKSTLLLVVQKGKVKLPPWAGTRSPPKQGLRSPLGDTRVLNNTANLALAQACYAKDTISE